VEGNIFNKSPRYAFTGPASMDDEKMNPNQAPKGLSDSLKHVKLHTRIFELADKLLVLHRVLPRGTISLSAHSENSVVRFDIASKQSRQTSERIQ
jgi:hypothetical protein